MSPKVFPLLAVAAALAGCTTPTARQDESSPHYAVPAGAELQLHRALEVRPGSTRAWIQHGGQVPVIDSFVPNCNLEISTRDDAAAQQILPGVFRVRRTQAFFEWVVRAGPPPRYARADDDGGTSEVYEGYHLWLENPDQPDVRRLSCRGVYALPAYAKPPSIAEIRAALGELATLRLP